MKAVIVGATGYSGLELVRLINNHPYINIHSILSNSYVGKDGEDVFPHLSGVKLPIFESMDFEALADGVEAVFFATPAGVSKEYIPQLIEKGIKCIDLSGDFRLKSPAVYEQWYMKTSASQEYLDKAVYGLSELNRNAIEGADLIANPGCFPTASLLAITPILKQGWVDKNSIIIDGKTGVSGAGRGLSLGTHFSETNENIKAYKLGKHQHIPEMEQVLSETVNQPIQLTFSAHLVPMTRGILCTIYMKLTETVNLDKIVSLYKDFYQNSQFVRIRTDGSYPSTKEVYGSNYCDIGFALDERTNQLIIVSVIDNVMKGAAGQAIQNVNIMMGWKETTGLELSPLYP
ncbi:N-acetyl-gamma-glutamyl-phosphate reductase [Paenisporosarcina sp. TG20]|uniref:N-acetyl-gamma-glutamyl-phosphate reductase n=1 Tax=Paenisporosarcina sp. TG20 TaxID=1211706 RepID=UPI00031F59BF|nr:N-acetyl-gamma-glutamyl-phosphate reductase [Paenisporosarcina sp. TG20]